MFYVLIEIGCLHCNEESHIIGIFTDKSLATVAKNFIVEENKKQRNKSSGQKSFEIFLVPALNTIYLPDGYIEDLPAKITWLDIHNREKMNQPFDKEF